ncbi:MAG: hypothetical protein IJG45_00295 [Oscillospiraceae bacterium]|nr:hypothetical protein [Oscillospiraceae bacterium]
MESVFFLGASTPRGFVSHYDSLFDEVRYLTVIKGGPGCGKSTLMRAIGRAAQECGMDISYILCSSDPDSLDGVILPQLGAAWVDGTAPHVLEPRLCGGSMNYLNLGECYDSAAMREKEDEILRVQRKNAAYYPHVTACLASADALRGSMRLTIGTPAHREEMAAIAECIAISSLPPVSDPQEGFVRRFLSAVTPKGLHFCQGTPAALCSRVYVLRDDYGLAPLLLEVLQARAQALGHACIACYSPLLPDVQPSHLLIPSADTAVVSESALLPYNAPCFCRIDLNSTLPPKVRASMDFYLKAVSALLDQAVAQLRAAKRQHDRLEALCKPFVDFSAVNRRTKKTIREIFGEN